MISNAQFYCKQLFLEQVKEFKPTTLLRSVWGGAYMYTFRNNILVEIDKSRSGEKRGGGGAILGVKVLEVSRGVRTL